MARNYVTNTTSLWHDPDFVALTPQQQALYQMLKGQREITAAGTLPLTVRRWTKTAASWTPELIETELRELEACGHVVIDRDTEELLVLKFVKFDGGYRNEKRRPVIIESAEAIISPRIRAALADELDALNALPDTASKLRANTHPDRPLDRESGFDRVVVKQGDQIPQPPTLNPQPAHRDRGDAASGADAPRTDLAVIDPDQPTAHTLVAEWVDHCPKRPPGQVVGQVAKSIDRMLAEGIDPADIRRGLSAWHTKGLSPSVLASVVNEVMNAPPVNRGQAETDALFERAARRLGVTR